MPWEDVALNRELSPQEVVKPLAQVFGIDEQGITIELGKFTGNVGESTLVVCSFEKMKGDFPTHLGISPWRAEFLPKETGGGKTIGRLCDQLNSWALVTGHYPSPYVWVLIRGVGDYQFVRVHPDKLDQNYPDAIELEITEYLEKFTDVSENDI